MSGISPPPAIGAVNTSELPPCNSPLAVTTMVTVPFFTCVTGISLRVSRAARRATRSPPQTSAASTTIVAASAIQLLRRIGLLRIGKGHDRARLNPRYRHFIGVPRQHLNGDRRVAAVIGDVDDRMSRA